MSRRVYIAAIALLAITALGISLMHTPDGVMQVHIGVGENISLKRMDLPEADGLSGFNPNAPVKSVGLYGFYYNMAKNGVEIQSSEGSLTFSVKKKAPKHEIFLPGFYPKNEDMSLGTSSFSQQSISTEYQVLDWCTARLMMHGRSDSVDTHTTAYISRVIPAIRYVSDSKTYQWESGSMAFNMIGYQDKTGQIIVQNLHYGNSRVSGLDLGAPWLMLWNTTAPDDEIFPLIITLQHKPLEINSSLHQTSLLKVTFEKEAGAVCVMLLKGDQRVTGAEIALWQSNIPQYAQNEADFWSRVLLRFPIKNMETYGIHEKTKRVSITNTFEYDTITDDWNTKPLYIAPVPPVTARAYESGYPVKWEKEKIYRSGVATLLGWFQYAQGKQVTYSLPIPESRDNLYASISVKNDPLLESMVKKMEQYCQLHYPSFRPKKNNLDLKELIEVLLTLNNKELRDQLCDILPELFGCMFDTNVVNTVFQPAGGEPFLQNNSNYSSDKHYDKEWYNGRHLDIAWLYAHHINPNVIEKLWPLMAGYYTYYRIHHDWAWSGVATQMVGRSLTTDGINFAFEGILAASRLALMAGDIRIYNDATYLASKQNLASIGSFDNPLWAQSIDYAHRHDYAEPSTRIAVEEVYTVFMSMYNEFYGTDLADQRSITGMSNGLNWNNPAQLREYTTYRYGSNFVHQYLGLDFYMPDWYDKNGIEPASGNAFWSIKTQKPAAMHLLTRSLLFGEDSKKLNDYLDAAYIQQQYGPYIRSLQGIIQSNLPQLWAPVNSVHVISNVWDGEAHTLTSTLKGIRTTSDHVDFTWRKPNIEELNSLESLTLMSILPKPGPKPIKVVVNHKNIDYYEIPGGFYRFDLNIQKEKEYTVVLTYDPNANQYYDTPDKTEIQELKTKSAAKVMCTYRLMNRDDLRLSAPLTREELAKMVIVAGNLEGVALNDSNIDSQDIPLHHYLTAAVRLHLLPKIGDEVITFKTLLESLTKTLKICGKQREVAALLKGIEEEYYDNHTVTRGQAAVIFTNAFYPYAYSIPPMPEWHQ